jgi:NitT/TauT family transport system substrate-binding protein
MSDDWRRRDFLTRSALAGAAGLPGVSPEPVAAEPPPETPRIKILNAPAACIAPQFVAEDLLRGEGFTELQYVTPKLEQGPYVTRTLASGAIDLTMTDIPSLVMSVDRGEAIIILAGVHVGCFELLSKEKIRSVRDLKGKTVSVAESGGGRHAFVAAMAVQVGLNPTTDLHFVVHQPLDGMRLFAEGKLDAFMGFPPEPQELRAKGIGHVVVSTLTDRPWSQYFCCLITGNREFVDKHPVATKRAIRAILKAASICSAEPERVAKLLVDKGYVQGYESTLQLMRELPFAKWREYNPEEAVRFHALRLHEAGMIKSSPQKILAQGTDWRFLNELKKELKG